MRYHLQLGWGYLWKFTRTYIILIIIIIILLNKNNLSKNKDYKNAWAASSKIKSTKLGLKPRSKLPYTKLLRDHLANTWAELLASLWTQLKGIPTLDSVTCLTDYKINKPPRWLLCSIFDGLNAGLRITVYTCVWISCILLKIENNKKKFFDYCSLMNLLCIYLDALLMGPSVRVKKINK